MLPLIGVDGVDVFPDKNRHPCEEDASGVEEKVEPVARAAGGGISLKEFYTTAAEDGEHDGEEEGTTGLVALRCTAVLKPDDETGDEPETKVHKLVDTDDMIEWCLRYRHETHYVDEDEPQRGERVVEEGQGLRFNV